MRFKSMFAVLALLRLLTCSLSCTNRNTKTEAAATAASEAAPTISFRITWTDYSGRGQAIGKIVDAYNASQAGAAAADEGTEAPARREADDLLAGNADAPVAHYVNAILLEAVKRGASDIHIEPYADALTVRYRIDGLLYGQPSPPRHLESALTARLKVMARLDLAEKRLPQDGVARVRVGAREIDVRVSTIPTVYGESVSLRLLMRSSGMYGMDRLGLMPDDEEILHRLIRRPHGILLVTGPTGSGKSTSLYA